MYLKSLKISDFDKVYYTLVVLFLVYFYVIPSVIVSVNNFSYYNNRQVPFENSAGFLFVSFVIFIFGFILTSLLPKVKNKRSYLIQKTYFYKKWFYILFSMIMLYMLNLATDINRLDYLYSVRKGDIQGNHITFLWELFFSAIKLSVIFSLVKTRKKMLLILFLILSIGADLNSAIGRTSLLFILSILVLSVFRIRAFRYSVILFFSLGVSIPLILNLKFFIYTISTGGASVNLLETFLENWSSELYLNNFGHPVISLLFSEETIDRIGYQFFWDYLQGFLFYLKPLGLDFGRSLIYSNTETILGVKASIIPTGFLAFGYIQLNYLGVFVSGIFFRLIGLVSEYVYEKINFKNEVICFSLAFVAANSFYHGEVRALIITLFLPLFVVYVLKDFFITEKSNPL